MAGKSGFKRLLGGWPGKEERKEETRAKVKAEGKEAVNGDEPDYKKKAKKTVSSRADHKHAYEEILFITKRNAGRNHYEIKGICRICGKEDRRFKSGRLFGDPRLWKKDRGYITECTPEEILKNCEGMKTVVVEEEEN